VKQTPVLPAAALVMAFRIYNNIKLITKELASVN